jgi:hypothetical protein
MYGYLMLGLPETEAELKNDRTKNEQMLTDVRLSEQLIVSDQMFIASTSSPYFGNTFVCALNDEYSSFRKESQRVKVSYVWG